MNASGDASPNGPVPEWANDERLARAAWSRIAEPGDLVARALVAEIGAVPAAALFWRPDRLPGKGSRPDASDIARWRVRLGSTDPVRDLATLTRFGGRLLIPGDPQWPPGLADLGGTVPFCLWVRGGGDLSALCRRSIAIVGARSATQYGLDLTARIAIGCSDAEVVVISGAAYGIDGQAHRAALAADMPTVAVLACGVDRVYPRGHEHLLGEIAGAGCVVSEVPPGSAPTRWRFLERNRLIAAMSTATVVIEAAWRSGALSTAHHAVDLGRPVGAVPGPVTSSLSAGCHRLIREGGSCVTDAAEALELLDPIGTSLPGPPPVPREVHDGLAPAQFLVLDALPLRSPRAVQSISRSAGLPVAAVSAALGHLLGVGLAEQVDGRWRRAPT